MILKSFILSRKVSFNGTMKTKYANNLKSKNMAKGSDENGSGERNQILLLTHEAVFYFWVN